MNQKEVEEQEKRIAKFKELDSRRKQLRSLLTQITEDWKSGPCEQGPFTSNTRESRKVDTLTIQFSFTLGGSPPVGMQLEGLKISAPELGAFLESKVREQLETIDKKIAEI